MKLKVVIIVYNRYENLKHWLRCWEMCEKLNAELVVIHNVDNPEPDYKTLVESFGALYIERQNIGFDIGAFQDVCKNRLQGFPEWDRLLWVTDDTFPMSKDFLKQFNDAMKPGVGVACMQISTEVRLHIRTTGFMIDRKVAEKVHFLINPITTKMDCYNFEHIHPLFSFYLQIKRFGLNVVQVAPNPVSPLWDSGYTKRVRREDEHDRLFGEFFRPGAKEYKPIVTFIATIYHSYPQIISALLMQTNPNWELWLIHDGPGKVDVPDDKRIKLIVTDKRRGNWGHSYRSEYLQKVTTKYVVITNADNYIVPVFIQYMAVGFLHNTVGVYCSEMVHSYLKWKSQPVKLQRGHIDCSGMMLRTELAKKVGWKNTTDHSADWLFFNDLIKSYGINRFVKVPGCLLCHN